MASAGNGTTSHLAGELFKMMTGVNMVHVPYRGGGPALTDLIAGRTQAFSAGTPALMPHIKSGRLRVLAVGMPKRIPALLDTPTVAESGFPGFQALSWSGISVARGTPQPVVDRLSAEILKAMDAPDFKERLRSMGSDAPSIRTPEQFASFVSSELKTYTELVKRSGAKAD